MVLKEEGDENKLSVGEVKIVMEKLGTLCDGHPDAVNYEEGMGPDEIAGLFEEEPSPEEVKEAFDIFDENNDGFIDAGELGRVLCSLGLMEPLEVECQRMIRVFDDNGDGRIDFKEFVKLVEHSFC
uniref:EF-hand domain-containing protein n=2 Tax=Quercus lobata TaxID=97700 RepID=A0A7N2MPE5_QUELO